MYCLSKDHDLYMLTLGQMASRPTTEVEGPWFYGNGGYWFYSPRFDLDRVRHEYGISSLNYTYSGSTIEYGTLTPESVNPARGNHTNVVAILLPETIPQTTLMRIRVNSITTFNPSTWDPNFNWKIGISQPGSWFHLFAHSVEVGQWLERPAGGRVLFVIGEMPSTNLLAFNLTVEAQWEGEWVGVFDLIDQLSQVTPEPEPRFMDVWLDTEDVHGDEQIAPFRTRVVTMDYDETPPDSMMPYVVYRLIPSFEEQPDTGLGQTWRFSNSTEHPCQFVVSSGDHPFRDMKGVNHDSSQWAIELTHREQDNNVTLTFVPDHQSPTGYAFSAYGAFKIVERISDGG